MYMCMPCACVDLTIQLFISIIQVELIVEVVSIDVLDQIPTATESEVRRQK